MDVYMEGLTRTNATGGIVMVTSTPLKGMSDVMRLFLESEALEVGGWAQPERTPSTTLRAVPPPPELEGRSCRLGHHHPRPRNIVDPAVGSLGIAIALARGLERHEIGPGLVEALRLADLDARRGSDG